MFATNLRINSNGKRKHMRLFAIILLTSVAVFFTMGETALAKRKKKNSVELDEAKVFIEWNYSDTDYGIQFFWDSLGFTRMMVFNHRGKKVLDVNTKRNVRAQGLTEAAFESVEPEADELSKDEFFARFPEGDYEFWGRSIEGGWLYGEAEFTHILPAPPENLYPEGEAIVAATGFFAGFDEVTMDADGNPLDIELYQLVVEKLDDDPILQKYEIILRPSMTEVWVPEAFLEEDTAYKLEVIVQEETGNRTISETDAFCTGPNLTEAECIALADSL
jgi:hypothetical protein